MSRNEEHLDRLLDRAIDQIRETSADREVVETAADRVWEHLSGVLEKQAESDPTVAPIRTCSDYQKMIPAYLEGRLGEARRLLLEDHGRECFACRKAIKQARTGAGRVAAGAAPRSRTKRGRKTDLSWGLAAAAIILVALVGVAVKTDLFSISTGGLLQVDVVDGNLLNIGDIDIIPVAVGETLENGEWIRTTKESGAVFTLDDGSRVEMDERSELYVSSKGKDNTIHLARGGIIVEAADQGDGHLFVDASDCQVAVTGTVFSVNRGTKGSRVAVLEGEVVVDLDGNEHVLHPGDQFTTSENLSPIPLENHVAWSRNADRHISLLHGLAEFRKELNERLPEPANRTSTRLLDAVPEGTVVYVAVPNLTASITEAHKLLQEKVQTNSALNAWWQENVVATGAEPEIARAMEKIGRFGDQLGEEIVIAVPRATAAGEMNAPVFLAGLKDPGKFRDLLHDELSELHARVKDLPDLRIVENPATAPEGAGGEESLTFWISGDILAVSPEIDGLRHLSSLHGSPEASRFVGSPFHARLDEIYREGAGLIIGADLESILADAPMEGQDAQFLDKLGISDVRHLIFERHEDDGRNLTTASLSFNQERRGIMAWLAEPAPMGSLEFISPNAMAVAAFVVRNPASMLGKFLDDMADTDGEFRKELERFQDEFNIDLVQDVAAPLGGEVAIALDGPVLPMPAWKLVVETYDPATLQRTLEWAVEQVNAAAQREGQPFRLEMSSEDRSGRTYHVLTAPEQALSVHYTFVEGYLIAAPQRVLLERAIQYRKAGVTLPASPEFLTLLPRDGQTNLSALAYQNLGPILGPMLQGTLGQLEGLSPDQKRMVDDMTADTPPSMFCAYGWKDRIDVVGTDRGGLLGSDLGSLFNLGSLMELRGSLANVPHEADGSM